MGIEELKDELEGLVNVLLNVSVELIADLEMLVPGEYNVRVELRKTL